jgi:hypothetical protein
VRASVLRRWMGREPSRANPVPALRGGHDLAVAQRRAARRRLLGLVPARGGPVRWPRRRAAQTHQVRAGRPAGPRLGTGASARCRGWRRNARRGLPQARQGSDRRRSLRVRRQPPRARRRVRGHDRRLVRGDLLAFARAPSPACPGAAARGGAGCPRRGARRRRAQCGEPPGTAIRGPLVRTRPASPPGPHQPGGAAVPDRGPRVSG